MQSLGAGPIGVADGANPAPRGSIVLPRLLRWPVRHITRLINQGVLFAPRNLFFCGLLVAATAGGAVIARGGHAEFWLAKASALAGLRIVDIDIDGLHEVSRIDILTSLDLGPQNSLLSFDVHRARDDLKHLAWVREAVVSKTYPDRLTIHITERTPFAVWQNGQALYLVERDGSEIAPYDPRYGNLPLFVGRGANRHGAEILAQVSRNGGFAGEVASYVRLGDRRWDLHLRNGVVVKLPETEAAAALEDYLRFSRDGDLASKAIVSVDMRFADRIIVRMPGEAASERRETVSRRIDGVAHNSGKRT